MAQITHNNVTLTITNSASTTAKLDLQHCDGGTFFVPTGSTLTSLTFHVSRDNSTWLPLYDSNGSAASLTVAETRAYQMPVAANACRYVAVVGSGSGTVYFTGKQAGLAAGQVNG